MSTEFKLPALGEGIDAGDVASLLVSEGDEIQAEQDVIEMETDKAVVPVPCPHAGKIEKILVKEGDRVSVGDTVLVLAASEATPADDSSAPSDEAPSEDASESESEDASEAEAAPAARETPAESDSPPRKAAAPAATPKPSAPRDESRPPAPAGPATRRLARELGVDLYEVSGSGPGGRITRDDVKAYVQGVMTSGGGATGGAGRRGRAGIPDFSEWGEVDRVPLKGIRKVTAESMSVAWSTVPHVTQFDEANITRLEAARKRYDQTRPEGKPKVTVTVLAMKAIACALREYPQFNSSLDMASGELVYKKYVNVGCAVDTEHGLLVPVIRDVDRKPVAEIASELNELASRARARKLDLSEMKGGSITVTNLGGIGGTAFTPIVNWPEVAILGLARARKVPVLEDGKLRNQLMAPLCLSYDHRVIDGADGARFLRFVASLLEDPFRLILEL